ncbi:MAG: acetyltransferase, partial [Muribaculaceae bacterium]|nr:acetyltransferase [Muribaculaceae bacterium]
DGGSGADVMVVGNLRIRRGSILAARAVVVKNFPEMSIIGGNPSRLIRSRVDVENLRVEHG